MLVDMILAATEDDVILRMNNCVLVPAGCGNAIGLPKPTFGPEVIAVKEANELSVSQRHSFIARNAEVANIDFDDFCQRFIRNQGGQSVGCWPICDYERLDLQALYSCIRRSRERTFNSRASNRSFVADVN